MLEFRLDLHKGTEIARSGEYGGKSKSVFSFIMFKRQRTIIMYCRVKIYVETKQVTGRG